MLAKMPTMDFETYSEAALSGFRPACARIKNTDVLDVSSERRAIEKGPLSGGLVGLYRASDV